MNAQAIAAAKALEWEAQDAEGLSRSDFGPGAFAMAARFWLKAAEEWRQLGSRVDAERTGLNAIEALNKYVDAIRLDGLTNTQPKA
jgi:hypothetical protein